MRRYRRLALLLVVLVCAFVAFLQRPSSTAPLEPVTLLDKSFTAQPTARDRFTMTLGPQKKWVSRAEHAIFGERKQVGVSADILQLSGPALTNLEATLKLPAPVYATNGLKVWFLPAAPLKEIGGKSAPGNGIEILTRPRVMTADGIAASMFMGQSVPTKAGMTRVGFGMECAARVHDASTELLTEIIQSELRDTVVQTNLAVNARLNVPKGKGVFLVQQPTGAATNGWGVVIHPLR